MERDETWLEAVGGSEHGCVKREPGHDYLMVQDDVQS